MVKLEYIRLIKANCNSIRRTKAKLDSIRAKKNSKTRRYNTNRG